jgi:hypothetical protein
VIAVLELATFVWLAGWATWAFRLLAQQQRHPVLPVFLVHFLFCGTPLLINHLYGLPAYIYTPGFYVSSRDEATTIIYCLYVSAVPVIWWLTGRGRASPHTPGTDAAHTTTPEMIHRLRPLFYLFIISPLLAWLFAPAPWLYLSYGVSALHEFNNAKRSVLEIFSDPARYKDIMFMASFLCIIGASGLLVSIKRLHMAHFYLLAPWIMLAIWLNGKRSIIAMAIFVIGYILWERGYLIGTRLVVAACVVIVLMGTYSYGYQVAYRGDNLQGSERWYENIRMDYGRDDVIKLAIFAELHPQIIRILEYRGQSFLFYSVFYVPRDFWPQKPYPYAVYSTSAIAMFDSPRQLGWGLTTSILEEAIANLSWAGMLAGPLVVSLVCRLGEACRNSLISAFTALIACLFLSVHLNAFMVMFLLWAMTVGGFHAWQWFQRAQQAQSADRSTGHTPLVQ